MNNARIPTNAEILDSTVLVVSGDNRAGLHASICSADDAAVVMNSHAIWVAMATISTNNTQHWKLEESGIWKSEYTQRTT